MKNRNLSVLKWCYIFNKTPMYFFASLYYYELTGSFAIVGSLFALTKIVQIFMEVPTGIISDKYLGRKGTFVVGSVLKLLGFICNLLGMLHIGFLLLAELFMGTYKALQSGNTASLLYESLQKEGKEKLYQEYSGKFSSYTYFVWSLSLLIAGFLTVKYGLYMAPVIGLVLSILYFVSSLFLVEPYPYRKLEKKSFKDGVFHLKESISILSKNPKLKLLTILFTLRQGIVFSVDSMVGLFYKKFLSLNVLGFLFAGSLFVCSLLLKFADKIITKLGFKNTFISIEFITIPLQLVSYVFPGIHSPFMVEASMDLNPIQGIAKDSILHKNFTDEQRATLESLITICGTLFLALCIFMLGLAADAWGIETALMIGVISRLILIPFYNKCIKD